MHFRLEIVILFVMGNNYFSYKGMFYLQIFGMAMGTNCAPGLGNAHVVQVFSIAKATFIRTKCLP